MRGKAEPKIRDWTCIPHLGEYQGIYIFLSLDQNMVQIFQCQARVGKCWRNEFCLLCVLHH